MEESTSFIVLVQLRSKRNYAYQHIPVVQFHVLLHVSSGMLGWE